MSVFSVLRYPVPDIHDKAALTVLPDAIIMDWFRSWRELANAETLVWPDRWPIDKDAVVAGWINSSAFYPHRQHLEYTRILTELLRDCIRRYDEPV